MAETELSFDMNMPIPYNNQLADVTLMVIHAKDAARKIGSSLSRDGDVDGEGGEEGGQNAGARSFKAALSRKMTIDKVKQIISESGIGKEAESSAFPGGPSEEPFEPSLMSADMSDVDEMTRSEMWQEIATLREREATLIRVLESYQIKELEQVPDDSKSSKSLAMAGLLIKALVRSKEEEAMAKNRLEAKKERMRNKALAKARNRGSSLLEAIGSAQDKAAAQEKDKMLLEVALMRMQYRDLWMLCTQVSNDPSIPAGKGIPPPPQFGQYFKVNSGSAHQSGLVPGRLDLLLGRGGGDTSRLFCFPWPDCVPGGGQKNSWG